MATAATAELPLLAATGGRTGAPLEVNKGYDGPARPALLINNAGATT